MYRLLCALCLLPALLVTNVYGLYCHCDPCNGDDKRTGKCHVEDGMCFTAHTKSEKGRMRMFIYGCTVTHYAQTKCQNPTPEETLACCDDEDMCNLKLNPTFPPPTTTVAYQPPESKTVYVMRIVAIVSGPVCVLYTFIIAVVCVVKIQRRQREQEMKRRYGYQTRGHELLPTSTEILRQQALQESSNSADSGIGEEERSPIYQPHRAPVVSPSNQQLLSCTVETHT